MAYAYVYAPISGRITGRDNYCINEQRQCDSDPCGGDHGAHKKCKGWASPIDIGATGQIYLYVNYPTVKKIQTWVEYKCCCGEQNSDYARTITVDLYVYDNGKYCYVGSVMYGHVKNPQVLNGAWYDLTRGDKYLGDIPGGTYTCNEFSCYGGAHSHMERSLGETAGPLCCCTSVAAGTTAIYRYYYNPGFTC